MLAVIESGAKQYLVKVGSRIAVERLLVNEGDKVTFDRVLLVSEEDGKNLQLGAPYIAGKTVEGAVVEQRKDKKIIIAKFKNKVRYRRKNGHRQLHTVIEIKTI